MALVLFNRALFPGFVCLHVNVCVRLRTLADLTSRLEHLEVRAEHLQRTSLSTGILEVQ